MRVLRFRRRLLGLAAVVGLVAALAVKFMAIGQVTTETILASDLGVLTGKTVVLDPGHGGVDSGARANGRLEKDITLELALNTADVLRGTGVNVVLTRTADIDFYTRGKGGKRSDLAKRVEIINTAGADLFLSIHTNAIRGARWFGAEVYYCPRVEENRRLAETLQQVLAAFPPGNKRQAKQDSDILVLKDTTIPGVLIEAGFLSNPEESSLLADPAYQRKMAEHIAKALAYHFSHNVAR